MTRLWRRRRWLPDLAEAIFWLILAGLVLRLLPFRRIAPALSPPLAPRNPDPQAVERVIWAVRAAARRLPFAVCFHQGIAAQRMLCRRGLAVSLHYGVAKAESGIEAHVWAVAEGRTILGGEVADRFTFLTRFDPRSI